MIFFVDLYRSAKRAFLIGCNQTVAGIYWFGGRPKNGRHFY